MQTVYDLTGLRQIIGHWRREGCSIALVPTMGNLHGGHLSLLERARELADRSIVSIFVNPIQFGKGEDYAGYPSTLEEDSRKLAANGLDLLFAPDLSQLYPGGIDTDTRVTVPELSNILCGAFRPGHFSGVATVVIKLLCNAQPDVALFGEKDYQQLLIIRRMVADLCIPVEIVGLPIVRERDGLAMSSRNAYLNAEERSRAPLIYRTLQAAAEQLRLRDADVAAVEAYGMKRLADAGFRPEYFSVRRTEDLGEPRPGDNRLSILAAAWLGQARLIDNLRVLLDG
ncbi:MAG: pantoate--beta-alanine ligase [Gammaproteobacteria bacterium]|nr:pantoate--beta-alanine ligase [Gammaproteobacteria bacterium]